MDSPAESAPVVAKTEEAPATAKPQDKAPEVKEGRIIVRNLPFDLKEPHLHIPFFEKYGKLVSVSIPINNTNNLNKGFAFLEYGSKAEALKAVEELNG